MAITMKDIAKDLGVSAVTVSKVLRNHSEVGAETRKRVQQRMKELNYRPNPAARALHTGHTNLIGLIVPDLVDPFFSQVTSGILTKLKMKNYGLIISSSKHDLQLEKREIDRMLAYRVEVLILASPQSDLKSFLRLEDQDVPYILLSRKLSELQANSVGADDVAAGIQATSHLIDAGCKTVAHIAGPELDSALDRQRGYSMTLAKHGRTLPPEYLVGPGNIDGFGDAAGYAGMKRLLQLIPRPDGVFCCNDAIAIGAMRAIFEASLKIPEDIALVGCGNSHYNDVLRVPLTSIDQDSHGLGATAAKLALSIVSKKSQASNTTLMLKSRLVVRASSLRSAGPRSSS
jgi:LacI family transcriptional regulator